MAASPVDAATIVQPTAARASTSFSGYFATDTRNGSGLSSTTIVETGDPVPTTWPTHDTDQLSGHTQWLSNTGTPSTQWIMFDLGQSYQLGSMHIWNWNDNRSITRGINSVDVRFATSLTVAFGSATNTNPGWGAATTTTFAQATGLTSYTGEDKSFTAVTARYVLFDVNSNYGDAQYVGLAETRFILVPEPSAALLSGLGALLLLRRRR